MDSVVMYLSMTEFDWLKLCYLLVGTMLIKILLDDRELHMELRELINLILRLDRQPKAERILIQYKGEVMAETAQLAPGNYLLTATPVDANGVTRAVQTGSYAWEVDDSTDASIAPQGDGSTALLTIDTTVADQKEIKVSVTANADPTGATTQTIDGELDVTAENAPATPLATSINITVGPKQ